MGHGSMPMDHSQMNHGSAPSAMGGMAHSQPTRERTSQNQTPAADHSKMDHGAMQGHMGEMDHSAMDHSKMNHGSADAARATSRTPIPVLTDADRKAAFPPLPGHQVHDSAINGFFLLDQLEYQDANDGSALAWDASGWLGGDINRIWFRSEGERTNGVTEDAELQLFFKKLIFKNASLVAPDLRVGFSAYQYCFEKADINVMSRSSA